MNPPINPLYKKKPSLKIKIFAIARVARPLLINFAILVIFSLAHGFITTFADWAYEGEMYSISKRSIRWGSDTMMISIVYIGMMVGPTVLFIVG